MNYTAHEINAYEKGELRAAKEIEEGKVAPDDDPFEDFDENDFVFALTGDKLDLDSEEASDLFRAYEDGYYDRWDDNNG